MNLTSSKRPLLETLAVVVLCAAAGAPGARAAQDPGWPREIQSDGHKLTVWQPQVDSWEYFVKLKGRMAAALSLKGAERPILGAIWAEADTQANLDARTVLVYDVVITEARFEGLTADESTEAKRLANLLFPKKPITLALDRVLTNLERTQIRAQDVQVKLDPPQIFYSESEAVLVLLDGEPVLSPVKETDLLVVVNTNWDLFQQKGTSRWYLLEGDRWLESGDVRGPWGPAQAIPRDFSRLTGDDWAEVRKHSGGPGRSHRAVPAVHVSTVPAEMILVSGAPKLESIGGTKLLYVTNTDSDLFLYTGEGMYYFLVGGRWFRAKELPGPWEAASGSLPADFAQISPDHPKGDVRASVPGTPEAGEALVMAQIPRKATVSRSATITVAYSGEPKFEPVSGTGMEYAVNTSYTVLHVDDAYYVCSDGIWFFGMSPNGPWVVATYVPQAVYTIPPSHPTYYVTYVYVYDSTPDVVVVGYTSGYWGVYVWGGCVVYGTGYYYHPYVYYGGFYPVYYPYPYSYGVAAWYNPGTGTYGRGAVVYGPYGGYGRAAAYNPATGAYARGVAAWGPYGGAAAVHAYNPSTGTAAATRQYGNSYEHWGESVVACGDDWIHTGHYANENGVVRGFETSEGGKGFGMTTDDGQFRAARTAEGDLYVGKDGNVYKKDENGWSQNNNGEWEQVERDPSSAEKRKAQTEQRSGERPATRQAEAPVDRDASSRPQAGASSTAKGMGSGGGSQDAAKVDGLNRDYRARSEGSQRANQWSSAQRSGSAGAWGGRAGGGGRRRR